MPVHGVKRPTPAHRIVRFEDVVTSNSLSIIILTQHFKLKRERSPTSVPSDVVGHRMGFSLDIIRYTYVIKRIVDSMSQ